MSEHPELIKKSRLFIPLLRTTMRARSSLQPLFQGGYFTTIVDSHASLQSSKNIPGKVKAHEVHAVATSLQLFQ